MKVLLTYMCARTHTTRREHDCMGDSMRDHGGEILKDNLRVKDAET
jgi:hypothetical protein